MLLFFVIFPEGCFEGLCVLLGDISPVVLLRGVSGAKLTRLLGVDAGRSAALFRGVVDGWLDAAFLGIRMFDLCGCFVFELCSFAPVDAEDVVEVGREGAKVENSLNELFLDSFFVSGFSPVVNVGAEDVRR